MHPIMKLPLPRLDGIVKRFFRITLSEVVAIAKALEPAERKAARSREKYGGRGKRGGKLRHLFTGKTRDKVALHVKERLGAETFQFAWGPNQRLSARSLNSAQRFCISRQKLWAVSTSEGLVSIKYCLILSDFGADCF